MRGITQRNGKFRVRFKNHSATFATQAEAERHLAGVQHGFIQIDPVTNSSLPQTLGELLQYTYDHRWSGKRSEESLYANGVAVVAVLGEAQPVSLLSERRAGEVVRNHFKAQVSAATVNRKLSALTTLITTAYELDLIDRRHTIKREREPEGRMRFITAVEEEQLVDQLDRDLGEAVEFLIDTGLRVNEMLQLQWANISDNQIVLTAGQTKGQKSRTIPLTSRAAQILMRHRDQPSPFSIGYRKFAMRFKDATMALGMGDDVTIHTLRHTFASRLVQAGVDLFVVAALLGHSKVATTQRYAHLATHNLAEAIETLQGCKTNDRTDYAGSSRSGDAGIYKIQAS